MKPDSQTIAVAFDMNFRHAAEIYSGVSDFARQQQLDWNLVPLQFGFETTLMSLTRSGQLVGAIGTFISDRCRHITATRGGSGQPVQFLAHSKRPFSVRR